MTLPHNSDGDYTFPQAAASHSIDFLIPFCFQRELDVPVAQYQVGTISSITHECLYSGKKSCNCQGDESPKTIIGWTPFNHWPFNPNRRMDAIHPDGRRKRRKLVAMLTFSHGSQRDKRRPTASADYSKTRGKRKSFQGLNVLSVWPLCCCRINIGALGRLSKRLAPCRPSISLPTLWCRYERTRICATVVVV